MTHPSQPQKSGFKLHRTVAALVMREMATTYGRSAGGYLWAILEPVAGIALLTLIFSLGFKNPPIGNNFAIFYATGILPFTLYMDISTKVATAIRFSRPLLFYPGVTYIDAILARLIINLIAQILVFLLLITVIIQLYDLNLLLSYPAIFNSLTMATVFALGVGTLNCFLISVFPIWERVWAILNRPMFIISCIFFLLRDVPEPYRGWLWYNPLVHITAEMRNGFYHGYEAKFVSSIYVYSISGGLFILGIILLNRYHRNILNN